MVFFADRMYQLRNEKGTPANSWHRNWMYAAAIQDYEEGKLYPHAITMVDIADFFDVSLDYLMGRTECREINKIKLNQTRYRGNEVNGNGSYQAAGRAGFPADCSRRGG